MTMRMKYHRRQCERMARLRPLICCIVVVFSYIPIAMTDARAQTTSLLDTVRQRPTVGATAGIAMPQSPSSLTGPQTSRHRGSDGRVCIRVSAVARPGAGTSRLFSHWIITENTCSTTIRLQVCYYGTRDCTDVAVLGNSRKETILGMMPAVSDFRFEYRERF